MKNVQTANQTDQMHLENIEKLRAEMILSGLRNGLDNPITLKLSKELDIILNKYQMTK